MICISWLKNLKIWFLISARVLFREYKVKVMMIAYSVEIPQRILALLQNTNGIQNRNIFHIQERNNIKQLESHCLISETARK